jgi:hypothetical protein
MGSPTIPKEPLNCGQRNGYMSDHTGWGRWGRFSEV